MIVLGICLLIIAALIPKLAILWGIGIIVLVVGVILALLGTMGRAVGGRRHYY
jgi:membrane-bound ClpP family serine protease